MHGVVSDSNTDLLSARRRGGGRGRQTPTSASCGLLSPAVAGSAAGDAGKGERTSARFPFPTHSSVAALWLIPYPA